MAITPASGTWRQDLQAQMTEVDVTQYTDSMIGLIVMPIFRTKRKTAQYPVFPREWWKKPVSDDRAPNGAYNRIDLQTEPATFTCEDHGNEHVLDDFDENHYEDFFDYEAMATRQLGVLARLNHERRVAALLTNETTFSATAAATAWATIATATPVTDVDNAALVILQASGIRKDQLTLVVNNVDWQYLNNATKILDRIKYVDLRVADEEKMRSAIASAMGIKQILIGQTHYDTKEEGVAESMSNIWPTNTAGLGYIAPSDGVGIDTGCAGRTVLWTKDSPEMPTVETYRDDTVRADVVRVRASTDEILQGDAGVFWTTISTDG